jgi:hypothetical protein
MSFRFSHSLDVLSLPFQVVCLTTCPDLDPKKYSIGITDLIVLVGKVNVNYISFSVLKEWYLMMGVCATKIDQIPLLVIAILVCLIKIGNVSVNNN